MKSGQVANSLQSPIINNLPGLIVLQHEENNNDDEQGIIGWNRCMAYYSLNSAPTNIYNFYQRLPTFSFTAKSQPQRRKKYRHHADILRQLFAMKKDDDIIKYTVGQYCMQTCVDDNQCCLITKARRDDIYHPIALLQDNKLISGLQINVGLYMAKGTNTKVIPIDKQPIRSIVTGMCMHGSNIKLVDNFGQEHLMTVTPKNLSKDQVIVEAIEKHHHLYPYERMTYKTFESMIPLFYILGKGKMPTIYYQLPTAEYIIHALDLLLSGHMTMNAFNQNVNYIIKRATTHYQWLIQFCSQNIIPLVTETPIQRLVLEDDGSFCLQSFFNRIQVSIDLLNMNPANLNLSTYVAQQCWIWLSQSQTEPFRSIWKFLKGKDANFAKENLFDTNSLQSLRYLSYTIQVTAAKQTLDSKRILMVAPFRERQISISYKKLFADKYGAILGLHWMMPILSNISKDIELYYQGDDSDPLDQLIDKDIVSQCFLETGAAAINIDSQDIYSYSKAKAQTLSEHYEAVKQ